MSAKVLLVVFGLIPVFGFFFFVRLAIDKLRASRTRDGIVDAIMAFLCLVMIAVYVFVLIVP